MVEAIICGHLQEYAVIKHTRTPIALHTLSIDCRFGGVSSNTPKVMLTSRLKADISLDSFLISIN